MARFVIKTAALHVGHGMRMEEAAMGRHLERDVAQWHPRKRPTVGAGSSQREDSPAHRNIRIPCHPTCPHEPVVLKRRGTPRRYGLRIIASA